MANKRNVFSPSASNLSAPKIGGKSNGLAQLMGYMVAQQKGQQAQQEMPNATVVGGTDPFSGVKKETPESVSKRTYTAEDIRTIGTAEAFDKHRNDLIKLIESDPTKFQNSFAKASVKIPVLTRGQGTGNILGIPTTLGDEDAININRALTDMSDRLLRLRSGAQINQQEYDRLTSLFPSIKDLSIPFSKDGAIRFPTLRKSLDDLNAELQRSKQRALQGGYYQPDIWGDVEQTGMASGTNPQVAIGANINGSQDNQQDPVEAIKARFRQRNP